MKNHISRLRELLDHALLRARIRNPHFSIICNNCWGSTIYQQLKRPYETPFVGLFLYPVCFLKLLEDLRSNLEGPLSFADRSKYAVANQVRATLKKYPLGIIGDGIEIHFIHYDTIIEAREKWLRRLARLSWENIYIAFVERELTPPDGISRFDQLPYDKKVCFTAKEHSNLKSAIWIRECNEWPYVTDIMKYPYLYKHRFDVAGWINRGDGTPGFWYRILSRILYPRLPLKPMTPIT